MWAGKCNKKGGQKGSGWEEGAEKGEKGEREEKEIARREGGEEEEGSLVDPT